MTAVGRRVLAAVVETVGVPTVTDNDDNRTEDRTEEDAVDGGGDVDKHGTSSCWCGC